MSFLTLMSAGCRMPRRFWAEPDQKRLFSRPVDRIDIRSATARRVTYVAQKDDPELRVVQAPHKESMLLVVNRNHPSGEVFQKEPNFLFAVT
jgi:hypothetical protein